MKSYEAQMSEKKNNDDPPARLDISLIKYFWQVGPFSGKRADNIPKFLRKITVLKEFSDNELRILSGYLHHRSFSPGEFVFNQNEMGIGFYFILSGLVDITVQSDHMDEQKHYQKNHVLTLEKRDYFGEIALLRQNSLRNASAQCREHCELLGVFKPDLDEMIYAHPIVANKLLQAVSLIVANRLFSVTKEVRNLKYKVEQLERERKRQ